MLESRFPPPDFLRVPKRLAPSCLLQGRKGLGSLILEPPWINKPRVASHSRKMPPKLGQADFVIVELMQIRFLNGLHGSKVVADNVMKCAYPVLYRGLFQIALKISF